MSYVMFNSFFPCSFSCLSSCWNCLLILKETIYTSLYALSIFFNIAALILKTLKMWIHILTCFVVVYLRLEVVTMLSLETWNTEVYRDFETQQRWLLALNHWRCKTEQSVFQAFEEKWKKKKKQHLYHCERLKKLMS